MPYVRWVSGEAELTQEDKMPVGRNVLELTNIHQSANYTCVATSSLGTIETTAQVFVRGQGAQTQMLKQNHAPFSCSNILLNSKIRIMDNSDNSKALG